MRLIRLKLKDFRQYRDAEVYFRDGMTAIVGANGTGKSTLLEAITYALYGKQRDDKKSIPNLRWDPKGDGKIETWVELEFEHGPRRFLVKRSIRGKNYTTNAEVHEVVDGVWKIAVNGTKESDRYLEKLLRLTMQQFNSAFCAQQKDLAFLGFATEKRQLEIAKMLGFDRLDAAQKRSKDLSKSAKDRSTGILAALGNRADLEQQLANAKRDQADADQQRQQIEAQLKDLEARQAKAEAHRLQAEAWKEAQSKILELEGLGRGLVEGKKELSAQLDRQQKDVQRRQELEPVDASMKALIAQLKEFDAASALAQKHSQLLGQIALLEDQIANSEALLKNLPQVDMVGVEKQVAERLEAAKNAQTHLEVQRKAWQDVAAAAKAELAKAEGDARRVLADLKKAESSAALGICPECGQETVGATFETILDSRRKAVEEASKSLEVAQAQVAASQAMPTSVTAAEEALNLATKAHAEAQEAYQAARRSAQERQQVEQGLAEARAKQSAGKAEIQAARVDYDPVAHEKARKEREALEPSHQEFLRLAGAADRLAEIQKALDANQAKLAEMKLERDGLREKQVGLGIADLAAADAAIQHSESLRQEKAAADANLKARHELIAQLVRQVEMAQVRLQEVERQQGEYRKYQHEELLYGTVEKEMKNLRDLLNREVRPLLEDLANENLAALSHGRYSELSLSENFESTLVDEGFEKSVISGGEEDIVALSLRLALAELIQEKNGWPRALLMLDEVFGSLDGDRRRAVLDRLHVLRGRFAQVLVISHIEEINEVADQCLYVQLDDQRCSQISDVDPSESEVLAV